MCGCYGEKLNVNHLWELKGKQLEVLYCGRYNLHKSIETAYHITTDIKMLAFNCNLRQFSVPMLN